MPLCSTSKVPRGARRASTVALAVATIATTTVTGEAALASSTEGLRPAQAPDPCPAAFPVEDLTAGQALEGLTVDSGTDPQPFTATVLGVLDDGIASGLDLIIAEASSDAITRAGGIWAGMSGSPVYIDTPEGTRLVGAVAYGLAGASPIAGITPATEMQKLLRGGGITAAAPTVELTDAIEKKIVATGAATAQEAASGLRRLPLPVAVSGTDPARLRRVNRRLNRHLDNVRVYPAGGATGRAAAVDLVPGGNVAAAISFGDTTFAGVGTVTAVCGDEALLFGHPLLFNGATTVSANQATAVFVQPDPIFGPFKVANIGGRAGTVDQDRLAGLHVELGGEVPPTTRVHSALSSVETGASRTATTRVVLPEFIPDVAFSHVLNNLDRVHDRIGAGVVTLSWGASGTRSDGSAWSFRRRELMADRFDATIFPAFKIFDDLYTLFNNPFEEITIDNVTASGTVDPKYAEARLVGLEKLGADGRWHAVSRRTALRLVAGSEVFLRGVFQPFRSTRLMRVQLSLVVPRLAGSRGSLILRAGASFGFFGEEPSSDAPPTFDGVLAAIDKAPTGDTLRAELNVSRESPTGVQASSREARATAPTAIFGNLGFNVRVISAAG
jgi:hypothetical protein